MKSPTQIWHELPQAGPYTDVAKLLLVLTVAAIFVGVFNFTMKIILYRNQRYYLKASLEILMLVKGWVQLGKEFRDEGKLSQDAITTTLQSVKDTIKSKDEMIAEVVEKRADELRMAVEKVPPRVVEEIKREGGDSGVLG